MGYSIIPGVSFSTFQDIQKNRESSRYCGWYKGVNFGWNSPYNDGFGYEAWRNCFELVNLNLQNREVKDYLFDVIRSGSMNLISTEFGWTAQTAWILIL